MLIAIFVIAISMSTVAGHAKKSTVKLFFQNAPSAEAGNNDILFAKRYLLFPSQITDAVLGRTYFPELDGYINDRGYLLRGSYSSADIDGASAQVSMLRDYCEATDRNFAYFILPSIPEYDSDITDVGIGCHRNQHADLLSSRLSEDGISLLDLRTMFRSEEDYYSFFYKTDHHWTVEASIIASREIVSYLNRQFSIGLNETAIAEHNLLKTELPSSWVGETGQKALGAFGERDSYTIFKPAYGTSFSYSCPPKDLYLEGSFDILTFPSVLENNGISGTGSSYHYYYLRDNEAPVEITNNSEQNGDLLIIKDSYVNSAAPFIALTAHKVTLWDMRSDPDLIAYLEAHPEITTVIIAYSTSFLTTSYMNQFFDN